MFILIHSYLWMLILFRLTLLVNSLIYVEVWDYHRHYVHGAMYSVFALLYAKLHISYGGLIDNDRSDWQWHVHQCIQSYLFQAYGWLISMNWCYFSRFDFTRNPREIPPGIIQIIRKETTALQTQSFNCQIESLRKTRNGNAKLLIHLVDTREIHSDYCKSFIL